jgi:hypothetical protein
MNLPCMPWMDQMLLQTQRYHHLVWFLYGCIEREHVLNRNACLNWWGGTFTPAAALTVDQGPTARQQKGGGRGYRHLGR